MQMRPIPTRWLIPDLLPQSHLVFLDGPTGVGKTCLLASWAAQLSRSEVIDQDRTILYLTSILQRDLIGHFLAHHDPDVTRLRHLPCQPEADFIKGPQAWYCLFTDWIEKVVKEHRAAVVVIDSFDELCQFYLNLGDWQWHDLWATLQRTAEECQCTIIIPRLHGLHESRQYGPHIRTGCETARFILTLQYHPIDPLQRILTVAKNQPGPIGSQTLACFQGNRMHLQTLQPHEHIRPASRPATWKPLNAHDDENQEIIDVVANYLNGQPAPKKEVKKHVLEQGYSHRAYTRAMSVAKFQSGKLSTNDWLYLPKTPRATGAAGDDPTPAVVPMPTPTATDTEIRLAV